MFYIFDIAFGNSDDKAIRKVIYIHESNPDLE